MKRTILYAELAKYYDLIYSFKDYKKEADRIKKLVSKYKKSEGRELLDVACGDRSISEHLKKGGVVLVEPWFTKSAYIPGSPHMETYSGKDIKIARLSVPRARGNLSVIDMHYLIAEKDEDVKYFVDRHELGLFELDETLRLMKKAGLKSKFLKHGLMPERGMFVGVKQLS